MNKTTNVLLGVTTLFILGIMAVPAHTDSNTDIICRVTSWWRGQAAR